MRLTRLLATCAVLLLAGCDKSRVLTVTLPTGYTGAVNLTCASFLDADAKVQVGANGQADIPCPSRKPTMHIFRQGKEVSPDGLTWTMTGDDVLRTVQFTVR